MHRRSCFVSCGFGSWVTWRVLGILGPRAGFSGSDTVSSLRTERSRDKTGERERESRDPV